MHYCCFVITREFPTDEVLEEALKPYNEDDYYENKKNGENGDTTEPAILWDYWMVGGRYNGILKLEIRENDEKYRWEYAALKPRTGRLFRSRLLETLSRYEHDSIWSFSENEYYRSMGGRDGFLYVDGGAIKDMINYMDIGCYCFIDANGEAKERGSLEDAEFDDQLKATLEAYKDCYICVVDLHS